MEDTTMEITDFVPKIELRQFLVLVIPGMIFSFTILCLIDKKLSCYKLLPADFITSVTLPYVSLLIFYLLTSGLAFGVIFHFLYLWRVFPRFIRFLINPFLFRYLFSCDNVPGNDSERLIKFLRDDLDIGWVESAEIRKSDDGKTIRIFKDENSAEIMIDEKKEKATLKISDGRTHDLKVKKEYDKLNIYKFRFLYRFLSNKFRFLYRFLSKSPVKNENKNKFLEYPGEFIEILLKAVNIDISYKQVYRTFFGSLSISTFLSFFVLLYPSDFQKLLVLIPLILLFIFSTCAAEQLKREVDSTIEDLVKKLPNFLEDVKESFPEEVYNNMLKK
jgi:hypothetical protein